MWPNPHGEIFNVTNFTFCSVDSKTRKTGSYIFCFKWIKELQKRFNDLWINNSLNNATEMYCYDHFKGNFHWKKNLISYLILWAVSDKQMKGFAKSSWCVKLLPISNATNIIIIPSKIAFMFALYRNQSIDLQYHASQHKSMQSMQLTRFMSIFSFYTAWNHGFLVFSGGIERKHWSEMA